MSNQDSNLASFNEHNREYLKHAGVKGMRWGVRKDRSSGKGGTSSGRIDAARKKLAKRSADVEKADDAWVSDWVKNGGKPSREADRALNKALKSEKLAKKAVKNAEKSDEVRSAESKVKSSRAKLLKADDDWASDWAKNGGKPDPKVDAAFKKALSEEKAARKELKAAKVKPQMDRAAKAKAALAKASKDVERLDDEWVNDFKNNGGKKDREISSRIKAAQKVERTAAQENEKAQVAYGVAKAKAFVEDLVGK